MGHLLMFIDTVAELPPDKLQLDVLAVYHMYCVLCEMIRRIDQCKGR